MHTRTRIDTCVYARATASWSVNAAAGAAEAAVGHPSRANMVRFVHVAIAFVITRQPATLCTYSYKYVHTRARLVSNYVLPIFFFLFSPPLPPPPTSHSRTIHRLVYNARVFSLLSPRLYTYLS